MDIREASFYCNYCEDTFKISYDNNAVNQIECPRCDNIVYKMRKIV